MTLAAGAHLGPHEIVSLIGAGGMGEVYQAHDTKLGRDVAIKVLPEAFAHDPQRLSRFQREAKLLASLNHSNIATIHGLEESNGTHYLVMELVPGETLRERVKREGPVPVEEALAIAEQIAEALEAAHEKSIIHRDLKPANVKVTPEGKVKVLDFGLAKAFAGEESGSDPSNSPTLSQAATVQGVILGTAAYMSPEQARGKAVDKRTDIWAFGCVLYELLTGRQAFVGEHITDILAAVMRAEPDWSRLPSATPTKVRDLLRRCLEKDKTRRLRDAGDASIEMDEALAAPGVSLTATAPATKGWRQALLWSMASSVATAILAAIVVWNLKPAAPRGAARPTVRLMVTLPPTDRLALTLASLNPVVALSPDGSRLVYVANHGDSTQLYVRAIDGFEVKPIPGTDGAATPFFSPDGQSVGFFTGGKLKKISLSGGAPLTLCSAAGNRGASWGSDDTIIFTPFFTAGLSRVSAAGGMPKPLTVPDHKKGEYSHRWPEVLPGGKAVLFTVWSSSGASFDDAQIDVLSLETGERRVLIEGGTYARYVPSGHLVYARAGGLLAVPFDLKRLQVTGPPVSVLEGVSMSPTTGAAAFSSSADGSLAYVPGALVGSETLLWVDRSGVAQPLPAPPRGYMAPRVSPDGQRLAVAIEASNSGLWLYDPARSTLTRLIEGGVIIPWPIWTPDGKRVTFLSALSGPVDLHWAPADGSGIPERLTTDENYKVPGSWSPDGQVLAFSELSPTNGWDVWVLKLEGDRKPRPFLQTPSNESIPMFSPDGRWLAYESDESGREEIYVRPFPGPGSKWQISADGGTEPVWARSGRELFYRNGDKMMAADIATQPSFSARKPKVLFEGHYESYGPFSSYYDVSPDGQRFLMVKENQQGTSASQINVVLNWFEELKRRVPSGK